MHEAKIALVDLVAHDAGALTIEQPAGADMLGGIHEDIDLAADIGREICDGLLVADIERHDLDTLERPQRILAGKRLPRFGDTDEYDRCAALLQRGPHSLTAD